MYINNILCINILHQFIDITNLILFTSACLKYLSEAIAKML